MVAGQWLGGVHAELVTVVKTGGTVVKDPRQVRSRGSEKMPKKGLTRGLTVWSRKQDTNT